MRSEQYIISSFEVKVKQTGNKNKEKFKLRYVTWLIPNSQELVL